MKKNRDMKAEKKVVDFLLDHPEEKWYLSQIARASGASVSTCHQILERKAKEKWLEKEKLGNLSLYSLQLDDALSRQLKIARTLEILKPLVKKLQLSSQKIILFGSAAQGRDTAKSDLDLFILTREKKRVRQVLSRTKFGRKIQALIKNYLELIELKDKDKYFYDQINKGLVIWEEKR